MYQKVDLANFSKDLEAVKTSLSDMTDVDNMWNLFSTELRKAVDTWVPTKTIQTNPKNLPTWFNKESSNLVKRQRKMYNQYKSTGDPYLLECYKKQRKETKKALRLIKKDYVERKICKPLKEGNSKPFYRHIKHTDKSDKQVLLLRPEGSDTDDPLECATILNHFFQSQFCRDHQLSPTTSDPGEYLGPDIIPEGIEKLIRDLKPGKAPGPDLIRKEDLQIDIQLTSQCLTHIYNKSLQAGKLPTDWKVANVTPIHKKGPTNIANNYRPISLTSVPCKILEHIVLRNLNARLDSILHHRQHGFRRGLSCETQLCSTMHDIYTAVDNSSTVHAVVMDFTKAFDRVPHALLMSKLSKVPDIGDYLLHGIHDFLTNRTQ